MAHGIDDNNGDIDRGQGIENVSKGSEIRGRQWRLLRRDDEPEELATTTEALTEEYDPKVLTTTTDASIE